MLTLLSPIAAPLVPPMVLAAGRWTSDSGQLAPKLEGLLDRMESLHKQMTLQGYSLDTARFLDRAHWLERAHSRQDVSFLQKEASTEPIAVILLRFLAQEGNADAKAVLKGLDPKHHATEYLVLGSFGSFMSLTFLTMSDNPHEFSIRSVAQLIQALAAKLAAEGY